MRFQLFQYPIPTESDLDDLNRFLASNRVVSVTREIVRKHHSVYVACCRLAERMGKPLCCGDTQSLESGSGSDDTGLFFTSSGVLYFRSVACGMLRR